MNKFAGGFAKSANVWRGLVAIFLVLTLIICFLRSWHTPTKQRSTRFSG